MCSPAPDLDAGLDAIVTGLGATIDQRSLIRRNFGK